MVLLDIKEHQIKALTKVGMNLSHFWVLHVLNDQSRFSNVSVEIPDVREVKLLKDRYLVDKSGLTAAGKQFYEDIISCTPADVKKKAVEEGAEDGEDNGFELWWKTFPGSANFEYKGVKFVSGRVLRSNKQICEMLYAKALAITGATPEQMLKALTVQLNLIKKESYETGKNGLQYMPGSEPYLRQGKYEAFLQQAAGGGTDSDDSTDKDDDYQNNSA